MTIERPQPRPTVPSVLALTLLCLATAWPAAAQPEVQIKRLTEPRIVAAEGAPGNLNVIKTLANHPKLLQAWGGFGRYILTPAERAEGGAGSTLPEKDRELVILRTVWLNGTEYEWAHHKRSGLSVGLSEEDIALIPKGSGASGWSSFERGLLRAAEQLHNDSMISDRTWGTLKARYSDQQMIDLVFTVGQYRMVSMAINAFGVQTDEGVSGW